MSSGTACVRLQIARTDFLSPSGNDTRDRSLKSLSGLGGGAFHYNRGYSKRLCTMPNSAPDGLIGATLMAATFHLHSMRRKLRPFLAPLVHPSWLQVRLFLFTPCEKQTPPLTAPFAHPLWLQLLAFAPCEKQTPPSTSIRVHPTWLQQFPRGRKVSSSRRA